MFCKNCGTELNEGSAFCVNCGQRTIQENEEPTVQQPIQTQQPMPSQPAKAKKKGSVLTWIFAALSVLLAVALVVVLVVPGAASVAGSASGGSSKGFDTPEAAIEYFIDRINEGDVKGALKVSYAEQAAKNYDFEALADRIKSVHMNVLMPAEYDFYREINLTNIKSGMLMQIRGLVISLTQPEYASAITEGSPVILDSKSADYEGLDPTLEGPIEIVEIEQPMPELYNSSTNRENMKKQEKIYGADDIEWRAVLYKYDGDYYVGGFQLIEYDGKWYVQSAQEMLIGQPPYGTLIPIDSKSDFDQYIE